MPKVSVNILTKDRASSLEAALESVLSQNFNDYEVVVVDDGSTDSTAELLQNLKIEKLKNLKIIRHDQSLGITKSRQEALEKSAGEYVAILDDDDEWIDQDKLKKQAEYLDSHSEAVLVGGGIEISNSQLKIKKFRPESDMQIRNTMLLRNNFFTSTVMFRRQSALKVGGFICDNADLAEDYDLWLRLVRAGQAYNFRQVFTAYRKQDYPPAKLRQFYQKQLRLIKLHKNNYPFYFLASTIVKLRILL